jgi:hypothetical protein
MLVTKSGERDPDATAIGRVLRDFCVLMDARRFSAWSALFTEDANFDGTIGRKEIRRRIENGSLARQPELVRKHTTANTLLTIVGDEAHETSDLIMYERLGDEPWQIRIGTYTSRLVRYGDTWLIASRALHWLEPA